MKKYEPQEKKKDHESEQTKIPLLFTFMYNKRLCAACDPCHNP